MVQGAGWSSLTAWKKEETQTSYGETPIECGAQDEVPLLSEAISRDMQKEPDNVVRNKAGVGGSDVTGKLVSGPVAVEAVYRGMESILVTAMGFCNYSASPETVAAGVYKHTFELTENLHTQGWGWTAFDGVVGILLAILIWRQWPVSGVWAIGILVGIRLIFGGWGLFALGSAAKAVAGAAESEAA